jgi:hypothetical protein
MVRDCIPGSYQLSAISYRLSAIGYRLSRKTVARFLTADDFFISLFYFPFLFPFFISLFYFPFLFPFFISLFYFPLSAMAPGDNIPQISRRRPNGHRIASAFY